MISAIVTIREALPEEFVAIADLTEAAYRAVGDDVLDEYVGELRDVASRAAGCPVFVAIDTVTGDVLGTVTYVPGPGNPFAEAERDDEAGFRMLAVATAAQGRGVGRALVDAVIRRARADGRRGIAMFTRPSMAAAQRLYEGLGFTRDPARDWEFEPGEWLWALVLRF